MAEYTIDTDASVFGITIEHPHPWICRDDDGDYWTVFKNLSGNIEIHKSEDNGVNWVNKKTLTNADYTGTPFPMNTFQIINLDGQDKVYILMIKKVGVVAYMYSWKIDTTTDTGSIDLDNVLWGSNITKLEVRWDSHNSHPKVGAGITNDWKGHLKTVNLNGTMGATETTILKYSTNRAYGFCIDSNGNKFFNAIAGALHYNVIQKAGTMAFKITASPGVSYDFSNVVCDHQDKIVLGCVYSSHLHIFKVSNDLSTLEINNANYNLGFTPSSCFVTIDGINDIYFVYTSPSDDEAYSIKYDISASSWGSPIKISSDNDGILVCPELKAPLNDSKLLVTYQATS